MNVVTIQVGEIDGPTVLRFDSELFASVSVHTKTVEQFQAAVAAVGGPKAGKLDAFGETVWFSVDLDRVSISVHAPKYRARPVSGSVNPALEEARAILEELK